MNTTQTNKKKGFVKTLTPCYKNLKNNLVLQKKA